MAISAQDTKVATRRGTVRNAVGFQIVRSGSDIACDFSEEAENAEFKNLFSNVLGDGRRNCSFWEVMWSQYTGRRLNVRCQYWDLGLL
jgi:hypothetical protein